MWMVSGRIEFKLDFQFPSHIKIGYIHFQIQYKIQKEPSLPES